jgi:hypothetical protein
VSDYACTTVGQRSLVGKERTVVGASLWPVEELSEERCPSYVCSDGSSMCVDTRESMQSVIERHSSVVFCTARTAVCTAVLDAARSISSSSTVQWHDTCSVHTYTKLY